jgi:hypothetical protein
LTTDPADASYFVAWIYSTIADASARDDYRYAREKAAVLDYLAKARDHFAGLAK